MTELVYKDNHSFKIFGIKLSRTTYNDSVNRIASLVSAGKGGFVCVANVSSAMEARYSKYFRETINSADLVTPDGVPLVWALKVFGAKDAMRVCGAELTLLTCKYAQENNIPVGFYGSTQSVLNALKEKLNKRFHALKIGYMFSPSFNKVGAIEDKQVLENIKNSGIKILFIGLGCPKQEIWMYKHKDSLPVVMLGVGAAFDFIAGTKKRAPLWMQNCGLEWFYRFMQEPGRLWKRYLFGNLIFALIVAKELFKRNGEKCKIQS